MTKDEAKCALMFLGRATFQGHELATLNEVVRALEAVRDAPEPAVANTSPESDQPDVYSEPR